MALSQEYLDQARAYRKQLNAQGIHYGEADRLTEKMFPGSIAIINPHKAGGFSKVAGAVGDVVGKVAPFTAAIPFVGPGIAALATGAGKLTGKLNDPGGIKGTKVFKDVVAPAALTYAGGKLAQGFAGAAKGTAPLAKGTSPLVNSMPGMRTVGSVGTIASGTASTVGAPLAQSAASSSFLGAAGDIAKGAGKWIAKNPDTAMRGAELGMNAYGAYQEGKAMDREWDAEQDQIRRRRRAFAQVLANRRSAGV
jgi:hypothetical protein